MKGFFRPYMLFLVGPILLGLSVMGSAVGSGTQIVYANTVVYPTGSASSGQCNSNGGRRLVCTSSSNLNGSDFPANTTFICSSSYAYGAVSGWMPSMSMQGQRSSWICAPAS